MVKQRHGRRQTAELADVWRRQRARPLRDSPGPTGEQLPRGWLLDAGLAEVLGPFARLSDDDSDDPIPIVGLDAGAATTLLHRLPAAELKDRQNWAPTLGDLLTVIAAHPKVVTGIGYAVGPHRCDERLSLDGLLIDDPGLFSFAPDLRLGPVPTVVSDLTSEQQEEYHEHRRGCVVASVERQQWFAARHRYRIDGAEAEHTEIGECLTAAGDIALRIWWT